MPGSATREAIETEKGTCPLQVVADSLNGEVLQAIPQCSDELGLATHTDENE